jgi:hypothetical protein
MPDEIKLIADESLRGGPAYFIGLLTYLYSYGSEYDVTETLKPAFGEGVADEVLSRIREFFRSINVHSSVRVEEEEKLLRTT